MIEPRFGNHNPVHESTWSEGRGTSQTRAHHERFTWEATSRPLYGIRSFGDIWPGFSEENADLTTTALWERDACGEQ